MAKTKEGLGDDFNDFIEKYGRFYGNLLPKR